MIGGRASRVVGPVVTLALLVALTGCGKLGAHPATGSVGSTTTTAASPTAPAPAAGGSAGSSTGSTRGSTALDGISQDLGSADTANTEAGSNASAGDQAGATGDEP